MRVVARLVCFFLFVLVFPTLASAVQAAQNGNQTPSFLFGMVVQVNYLRETNAHDPTVEIRLQQAERTITVRLGPSSFLNEYGFLLKEGEDISVRDASSTNEKQVFVGMEITKGSRRLTLRDDDGHPLW